MMSCSRTAPLLYLVSALLIPAKYIQELSGVIAEPLLVNTEKSGSYKEWGETGGWDILPRFEKESEFQKLDWHV